MDQQKINNALSCLRDIDELATPLAQFVKGHEELTQASKDIAVKVAEMRLELLECSHTLATAVLLERRERAAGVEEPIVPLETKRKT